MWPLLVKLGFDAKPYGSSDAETGTITSDKRRIDLAFEMPAPGGESRGIKTIQLSHSYTPAKRVSPWFLKGWQEDHAFDGGTTVVASVGLDGKVQVRSVISTDPMPTEDQLRARIVGFDEELRQLRSELPEAEPGSPPFKLDEDQRVDALDNTDTAFLLDSWGWVYRGPHGGSSPTWVQFAWVDGVLVFVAPACPGKILRDHLTLTVGCDVSKDAAKAASEIQKKFPKNVTIGEMGSTRLFFATDIDLSNGLAIKELKAKMLDFATRVSPYAKGKQGLASK